MTVITSSSTEADGIKAIGGLQALLKNTYGIAFNCYYAVEVFEQPSTFSDLFDPWTIAINLLNGLGNIYQNVYYIFVMPNTYGYIYYYSLGYEIGNSVMRIFYSPASQLNN